jgi:hypothetical protein
VLEKPYDPDTALRALQRLSAAPVGV